MDKKIDFEGEDERGRWKTHIYIPGTFVALIRARDQYTNTRESLVDDVDFSTLELVYGCFPSDATKLDLLHISLSRQSSLKRHEIDRVRVRIAVNLRGLRAFTLRLSAERLVELRSENDVMFGGLRVTTGKDQVHALIDAVDEALVAYGQEPYYEERVLHCSLVQWSLEADRERDEVKRQRAGGISMTFAVPVKHIVMRSGHLTYLIKLPS